MSKKATVDTYKVFNLMQELLRVQGGDTTIGGVNKALIENGLSEFCHV